MASYAASAASEDARRDPIVAVLPKTHTLAPGQEDLRSLAGERFVLVARETSSSLFDKVISLCSKAGFVVLLVQAGEGIAILPKNLQ